MSDPDSSAVWRSATNRHTRPPATPIMVVQPGNEVMCAQKLEERTAPPRSASPKIHKSNSCPGSSLSRNSMYRSLLSRASGSLMQLALPPSGSAAASFVQSHAMQSLDQMWLLAGGHRTPDVDMELQQALTQQPPHYFQWDYPTAAASTASHASTEAYSSTEPNSSPAPCSRTSSHASTAPDSLAEQHSKGEMPNDAAASIEGPCHNILPEEQRHHMTAVHVAPLHMQDSSSTVSRSGRVHPNRKGAWLNPGFHTSARHPARGSFSHGIFDS